MTDKPATQQTLFRDLALIVNKDPSPEDIRKNPDGSEYIPISIVQDRLDIVFKGLWSWNFEREVFGKTGASGKGLLSYKDPYTGEWMHRSGTAAIYYDSQLRLDFPRLEAMCILNAAKKIGKWFGRDLNRQVEDAPLNPIQPPPDDTDKEFQALKQRIIDADATAAERLLNDSSFRYNVELKQLIINKK